MQDNLQRLQGQANAAAEASAALEGELAAEVHCTSSVQALLGSMPMTGHGTCNAFS